MMPSENGVGLQRLDIYIKDTSTEDLIAGSLQVLHHVRPHWSPEDVRYKHFTDGITNRLVGCFREGEADLVLIRVYGKNTDLLINRSDELQNFQAMQKAGLAPPVYCAFQNGFSYGFIPGQVLDHKTVRDPMVSKLIAEKMAKMHSIQCDGAEMPRASLFSLIRRYLSLVPSTFPDHEKNQRYRANIPCKERLEAEVDTLESHLSKLGSPTVFCHNDLLLKNIIYNEKTGTVAFIDYEYGSYNYQAFDIGNHFAEFAGVDLYDPQLYPEAEFQMFWLRNYLDAWYRINGENPDTVTTLDVEIMYVQVNKFALAAHMLWGLWALIQSEHSTLDFDYLGFAIDRLGDYFARRDNFLNLQLPSSCDRDKPAKSDS